MKSKQAEFLTKLRWSLPWLMRYPFWAAKKRLGQLLETAGPRHLIFVVANHFEPSWNQERIPLDWAIQRSKLQHWSKQARQIGRAIRDFDSMPFCHTYFVPAEQYHPSLLDDLAELQAEGFGEIEIHLHHGVRKPDTADDLKRTLETFRDVLAERHGCLSRLNGIGAPMYAFVHGNLALGNSRGGRCCGVDSEFQVLAETGCYADFSLPTAPDQSQVPRINTIYQCGRPLHERSPHRSGRSLRVNDSPALPVLFTGPLVLGWRGRRLGRVPIPSIEDSVLSASRPPNLDRLRDWRRAGIGIRGRADWSFIKLHCHAFFTEDQPSMIGDSMRVFLEELLELADRSGEFKVHFATAREAFNIAMAAVEGQPGEPGRYRDYRLHRITHSRSESSTDKEVAGVLGRNTT